MDEGSSMKQAKSHEVRRIQPAPACKRTAEPWRYESPLGDRIPQNRLGQYVGPIPLGGRVEVGLVRFGFLAVEEPGVSARVSVSSFGGRASERAVSAAKLDSWESDGLEIHMLVYLIGEKQLRCSILVDKK